MDMSMNGIFAEYNREMLKQYDLFFIDTAYGTGMTTEELTENHLLDYMNTNFDTGASIPLKMDLTALRATSADISNASYATDGQGAVFRYQIDRLMKTKYGLGLVKRDDYSSYDVDQLIRSGLDYEDQKDKCEEEVNGLLEEINENRTDEEGDIVIDNPAEGVGRISESNILAYALKDIGSISNIAINNSNYVSERKYSDGAGLRTDQESPDNLVSRMFFEKYIFEKCGHFGKEKEGSLLGYQVEYLLAGKESDTDNLETVARNIFLMRYGINMVCLFNCPEKRNEAQTIAAVAALICECPDLEKPLTQLILLAWGYAESANDLRLIFEGDGVPMAKSDDSWNMSLLDLIGLRWHLGKNVSGATGPKYNEYLYMMVAVRNKDVLTKRLMNICEMDVRKAEGSSSFRMDRLLYQGDMEVNVSSGYGYHCSIRRFYSYE
jgi:hypothetical protein